MLLTRNKTIKEIIEIHLLINKDITSRIAEFKQIWQKGSDEDLFRELVFCLLTPQSSARMSWKAVQRLIDLDLLHTGSFGELSAALNIVRFRNNKAKYIIEAREKFLTGKGLIRNFLEAAGDVNARRELLARSVKGLGFKEASHFLRNIGFCENIAILDRHILRRMKGFGLIEEIPANISPGRYLDLEEKLRKFSGDIAIPLSHVDFVLFYMETGDIFK